MVAQWSSGLSMGGGVQVFFGDGFGGFQPGGGFALVGFANGPMAVSDLNGDGRPDIVVGTAAEVPSAMEASS